MSIAPVVKEVDVAAPPERAFTLFTERMGAWWPRTHSIGSAPLADVVVEPRAGGRWYERGEDGSECSWGRVIDWAPPKRVLLAWQIDAGFKYDAAFETEVEITFTDLSPGTRVRLEHRNLERFGERAAALAESLRGGWPSVTSAFADFVNQGG